jgi:phosphoglycerate kinase
MTRLEFSPCLWEIGRAVNHPQKGQNMSSFKTLKDFDPKGKTVLIRLDVNVPTKDGVITDETRIICALPSLKALRDGGAKTMILAHQGRPKGQLVPELTLGPIADVFARELSQDVRLVPATVGPVAKAAAHAMQSGDVILLQNCRFDPREESKEAAARNEFAAELAELADVYVNDAFSVSHRAHTTVETIAQKLPAYAGLLMQDELTYLDRALGSPSRPLAAVVGGAKVSTKLDLLSNLVTKVDALIIGGGMANTFLAAQGYTVGQSLCEYDLVPTAKSILTKARETGCEILLPSDVRVATRFEAGLSSQVVSIDQVPEDQMILDTGPTSAAELVTKLSAFKTLVWNGPLGAFEIKPYDDATNALAIEAARLTKSGDLVTVAGGGDTVSALIQAGAEDNFSYISTAGGAFLEWLEGKTLPGVKALEDAASRA